MESSNKIDTYLLQALQLAEEGKAIDVIRLQLTVSGADESTVETIVGQVKSVSFLKRRKRGVVLGAIGSLLLITGFILTVIFYHSGIPFHFVMYGMTSLGVLLLIAGLVEVIGW